MKYQDTETQTTQYPAFQSSEAQKIVSSPKTGKQARTLLDCETPYKSDKYRAIALYLTIFLANRSKSNQSRPQESGFSLIESLVAVAVVSILIVAIAPMVALSTSARINARRIDQATQAARSYVDAVRGGVIDVSEFPDYLVISQPNAQGQYVFEVEGDATKTIAAPTIARFSPSTICNNTLAANVQLGKAPGICIDTNGNGFSVNDAQDLVIQPMRSGATGTGISTTLQRQGFWLAVRVYRSDVLLASSGAAKTGTEAACKSGGTAFSATSSITCPLVTIRSQILPIVDSNNIDDIRKGIGSN